LEWKPYLARLAYDAAEDFGRWEFTTDLEIAPSGDRLRISGNGYNLCAARGRTGCPAVTAGLQAQDGTEDVQVNGKAIISPNQIRSMLMTGFQAQKQNEDYIGYITDSSEAEPYRIAPQRDADQLRRDHLCRPRLCGRLAMPARGQLPHGRPQDRQRQAVVAQGPLGHEDHALRA
jgi:hypothetical protein